MRKFTCAIGISLTIVLAQSGADAASCEGVNARFYETPTILNKTTDGTTTMLINSTGSSTMTNPVTSTLWEHCVGFWTSRADKFGSGAGSCYSIDGDGDQWIISWDGTNTGGNWAHQSGSGKYAKRTSAKGSWKSVKRFEDGMSISTWEGDCGD